MILALVNALHLSHSSNRTLLLSPAATEMVTTLFDADGISGKRGRRPVTLSSCPRGVQIPRGELASPLVRDSNSDSYSNSNSNGKSDMNSEAIAIVIVIVNTEKGVRQPTSA